MPPGIPPQVARRGDGDPARQQPPRTGPAAPRRPGAPADRTAAGRLAANGGRIWSARLWCAIRYTATPASPSWMMYRPSSSSTQLTSSRPSPPSRRSAALAQASHSSSGSPAPSPQVSAASRARASPPGASQPAGSRCAAVQVGQVGVERVLDRVAHLLLPARLGGVHRRSPQLVGDQPGQQERAAARHRRLPGQMAGDRVRVHLRVHPGQPARRCRRACPPARAPARPDHPGPVCAPSGGARPAATAPSGRAAAPGWTRSLPHTGPAAAAGPPRSGTPARAPHPAHPPRSPAARRPAPPRAAPAPPARRRCVAPPAPPAPPPAPAGQRSDPPPGPRSAPGHARARRPTARPDRRAPAAGPRPAAVPARPGWTGSPPARRSLSSPCPPTR